VLAFELEYLLGRSFAGSFQDRSQPEWPPHPGRLFSALAAAYFENGRDAREREALEWLERQAPPGIRAGEPGASQAPVAYVPTNYPGDGVPVLRGKQPRYFPAQAPSETTVHFVWPADPPPGVADALDSLASRTAYLGKACSLVRMRVVTDAPAPDFEPDPSGEEALRVPSKGRLVELERLFQADQQVSPGAQHRYSRTARRAPLKPASTDFGSMFIYRVTDGPGLPIEAALTVTEAVRSALLAVAGNPGPAPPILNGHEGGSHCAIAALPFVGGQHGDGRLMGFAVILPRPSELGERRRVLRACATLQENGLHIGDLAFWRVQAAEADDPARTLRPLTWIGPSREWRTVTPILLDRFPKKNGPAVEDILRLSCTRAGLPEPASITHGPYSELKGVPPVPSFRLVRKGEERSRWGVHATLTFADEIRGPALLGAGRFFGLGLLQPQMEDRNGSARF
jgi:CRISPR-associated protein Csb2